jgi:hypothetical protein
VSHHVHRRLHPDNRQNQLGTPVSLPSPWIETKVSEMGN